MDNLIITVIVGIATLGVGYFVGVMVAKKASIGKSHQIIKEAEEKAEVIRKEKELQIKEKYLQMKSEHERIASEKNRHFQSEENRLRQKEGALNANCR